MGEHLKLKRVFEERPAIVTVDRPQVWNALHAATSAWRHSSTGDRCAAKIAASALTGAGDKALISGAGVHAIREGRRQDAPACLNSRLMSAVESPEATSIATPNGFALGRRAQAAARLRLPPRLRHTVFGFRETSLGILRGAGGTRRRRPESAGSGASRPSRTRSGSRDDASKAVLEIDGTAAFRKKCSPRLAGE